MRYQFNTNTCMKEYNVSKYWIDNDIVPEIVLKASSLSEALHDYATEVFKKSYVKISDNALRCKHGMYVDSEDGTKQIGYVITGMTDIDNKRQFVDLWVEINQLEIPEF